MATIEEKIKYAKELADIYSDKEIYAFPCQHEYIKLAMNQANVPVYRDYIQGAGQLGWNVYGQVCIYKGRMAGIVKAALIMSRRVNERWRMDFDEVMMALTADDAKNHLSLTGDIT